MPLKNYLIILKTGIYLSFISVFLVFTNLLFPYITSKQIYFNILVEIMMVFWLAMIIKYPSTRPFGNAQGKPKKSYITFGLAAFFAAMLVSSIFGVDFNMSFWGNIERMLGWFHVFHFFLYYLIIISVFRGWRDWRNLFWVSLAASLLVGLNSLLKTPMSTIGNTAYVSGYVIFNAYFALILYFRARAAEKNKGDWLSGVFYLAAAFILASVLSVTHTRGAYVGLGLSFILFLVLFAFKSTSKKIRLWSFGLLAAAVAAVVLVFSFPQSGLVKNSSILSTLTQISSKAVTFQTRLISWKGALKDFPNHPILGTGYGNYAITFDKYFDPSFYSFTDSETYFDRAHNNLVDITSTAGLLGLLTYLSIFAAVGYYLWRGKKQGKIQTLEFFLLICLFTAYFIQNLAVFDSLVTYISLMISLGFVYWLTEKDEEENYEHSAPLDNREIGTFILAGLIFLAIIYQYNLKPYFMLDATIGGQIAFAKGDADGGFAAYKRAMSYQTVLDRDSRKSLINLINGSPAILEKLDKKEAEADVKFLVDLAEANVKYNPLDSMMQMQLAQTYNTVSIYYAGNAEKFNFYANAALAAIDKSIAASPGRVTIFFTKAQIYLERNDKENAYKTLEYAYSLNEKYPEAICYLAKVKLYFNEQDKGYEALDKCLDLGGAPTLNPVELVKLAIARYTEPKDPKRLLPLYQRWTALEPGNAGAWINLSILYADKGDKANAISAAKQAASIDKTLRPAAQQFIDKLGGE